MASPHRVSASPWFAPAMLTWASAPTEDLHCDVLVVGAGLAGASTAWHLSRLGIDVLLVDARPAGTGASGRSAGFLLLCNAAEIPAFEAAHGRDGLATWLGMTRANTAWVTASFHEEARVEQRGSLMLAEAGDAERAETLVEAEAILRAHDIACALEPTPAHLTGFAPSMLRLPADAGMDPARLTAAVAARVPRRAQARVTQLDLENGSASLGGHRVQFERVVLAANAWSGALDLLDEVALPRITHERAQCLQTEPLDARVLPEVVYANEGFDYFRQLPCGRLLLGGRRHLHLEDEHTDDEAPSGAVQASLHAYIDAHLPFARGARIGARWAGTMGFTEDRLPLLGPLPGAEARAFLVAGFSGHGMSLAGACGATAARWLTGRATELDARAMDLFAPTRA